MMEIIKATVGHVADIKLICDNCRDELGFIKLFMVVDAVEKKEVLIAVHDGDVIGFVHYHHRNDKQTTIREIAVVPGWRGQGVGTKLVEAVDVQCEVAKQQFIRLKCPVDLEANGFWKALSFWHISIESGKRRHLNVWEKRVKWD